MSKLNDLQMILLAHAAKKEVGSIFPLGTSVTDQGRARKELKTLLRRGLVAETETTNPATGWRQDGDIHFGLIITEQGKAAIGLGGDPADNPDADTAPSEPTGTRGEARSGSKIANVLALLRRGGGATLAEMVEATGWLPHTTRAALTGLKKKGHVITRSKRGEATVWFISEASE